jgi:hypothetical protein
MMLMMRKEVTHIDEINHQGQIIDATKAPGDRNSIWMRH